MKDKQSKEEFEHKIESQIKAAFLVQEHTQKPIDLIIKDLKDNILNLAETFYTQFTAGNAVSDVVAKSESDFEISMFKKYWYGRNPVHERNADSNEDMFWATAEMVAREYCTWLNKHHQPEQTNAVSSVSDEDIESTIYDIITDADTSYGERACKCASLIKAALSNKGEDVEQIETLTIKLEDAEKSASVWATKCMEQHNRILELERISNKGGARWVKADNLPENKTDEYLVITVDGKKMLADCDDNGFWIWQSEEQKRIYLNVDVYLDESPMQLGEVERLTKIIKQLYVMYNREVMFPDKLESHWQQFCTENNLK